MAAAATADVLSLQSATLHADLVVSLCRGHRDTAPRRCRRAVRRMACQSREPQRDSAAR